MLKHIRLIVFTMLLAAVSGCFPVFVPADGHRGGRGGDGHHDGRGGGDSRRGGDRH
jgi:hypothetical protein